jgi:hypothetical protein
MILVANMNKNTSKIREMVKSKLQVEGWIAN